MKKVVNLNTTYCVGNKNPEPQNNSDIVLAAAKPNPTSARWMSDELKQNSEVKNRVHALFVAPFGNIF